MQTQIYKVLFILGTRPEAIKLAPLLKAFGAAKDQFEVRVCATGQHRELLWQALDFFQISVDYNLDLMEPNQTLSDFTARCLKGLSTVFSEFRPELVIVQGDTTTAFVGALEGYYNKSYVAHVEAGLRSQQRYSPYPEEMNRVMISRLADFHFAPTVQAEANLLAEGIVQNIYVTGNTVVDALLLTKDIITQDETAYWEAFEGINLSKKIILVTCHRRESFGHPFENICLALKEIAATNKDCVVCYPRHLNPNVKNSVVRSLSGLDNIHLMPPLDYPHMVFLMSKAFLVLTDSGGIQEEAPTFGKPVLVMREVTERVEGIEAGTAELVGTKRETIVMAVTSLLNDPAKYKKMAEASNPYGDGRASQKILMYLRDKIVE